MRFISELVFLPLLLKTVASSPSSLPRQADSVAFFDPAVNGGSQLDNAGNGLGEPLNVIISGLSSSGVLTDDGIFNWAQSVDFSPRCLGIHIGGPKSANLGDGNGFLNQIAELRENFGAPVLGPCVEGAIGGNRFRYWQQNGAEADSGAFFLAVSQDDVVDVIAPNAYDSGRDALVAAATSGPTSFGGVTYTATSENITGLLPVGSAGVNGGIALDGIVKLLTITIM